jgi:uncharacterized membrane protein YedE/YeeE
MGVSSGGAGGSRVRRLFQRASRAGSITGVVFQGVAAIALGIATAIASGVLTVADLFIIPVGAFADAAGNFIGGFFGGIGTLFGAGAAGSASQIGPGSPLALVGFPLAAVLVALTAYVIVAYASEEETTNFFPLIGSGIDLPTPGFTDSDEEEEG